MRPFFLKKLHSIDTVVRVKINEVRNSPEFVLNCLVGCAQEFNSVGAGIIDRFKDTIADDFFKLNR